MPKLKSLFTFIILLSLAVTSQAQFRWAKAIDEVEILAGPSLVSLRGVKSKEYNRIKIGYCIGVGTTWYLTRKISLCTKLLYERKGINRSYEANYFDEEVQDFRIGQVDEEINLNYFSMPVSIQFVFGKEGEFHSDFGIYASYLNMGKSITSYSWKSGKEISNLKDGGYEEFDAGISFTLGYKKSLKKSISLHYWVNLSYGLYNISNQGSSSAFDVAKNESISIGISIVKIVVKNKS